MKILHLDIETAPNKVYTWGLFNQNVGLDQIVEPGYTLCWAAKWHGKKKVMFNSIQDSEESMVKEVYDLLEETDVVVHYNGENFDMPILNKEFVKFDLTPPSGYQQVDLLKVARKRFRFASNKLDFVAQFLGLGSKTKHKGMGLWNEVMQGDERAWKTMKEYNIQDVKLLEDLYNRLLPWINNHPNHNLYNDDERPVCTNCGSSHVVKVGIERLQTQSYQRYRCQDCGTPLRGRHTILPKEKRMSVITQSRL